MFKEMRTIIMKALNCFKQFLNSKKAPTINVIITIGSGDNNKVDVSIKK